MRVINGDKILKKIKLKKALDYGWSEFLYYSYLNDEIKEISYEKGLA